MHNLENLHNVRRWRVRRITRLMRDDSAAAQAHACDGRPRRAGGSAVTAGRERHAQA